MHITICSQCTHSLSRYTQVIPGLQRHSGFRSLAQGATSSKPSTGRERKESERSWGPSSTPHPGGSLLTRVTGAAHLADGEMVPVFIVGTIGASLANGVLALAACGRDKLACEASGARGVSGDRVFSHLRGLLRATEPLLGLFVFMATQLPLRISVAAGQWLMLLGLSLPASFTSVGIALTYLNHPGFPGPLFSPGGQREQQT